MSPVSWVLVRSLLLCHGRHHRRNHTHQMDMDMEANGKIDQPGISRHTPTTVSPVPSCEMCRNYELQLQIVQLNEEDLKKQVSTCNAIIHGLKEELKKEQNNRQELEEKFTDEARITEEKLKECSNRLDESNSAVTQLRELFEVLGRETSEQIAQFSSHKEALSREMERLHRENQALLGKHIAKAQEIQSEPIDLPNNMDDIHFYLLKLREDFITAVASKENLEEYVNVDRNRLIKELQKKEAYNDELRIELERLRTQFREVSTDHEDKLKLLRSQEELLQFYQERIAELILQKDEVATEMKWKLDEVTKDKSECEREISSLKSKVQSLQVELDNSEAVQRDFVKLSQSLQVSEKVFQ